MGTYQLNDLVAKWKLAELTPEQAIGQVLLFLQTITERLEVLERQVAQQKLPPRKSNRHGTNT